MVVNASMELAFVVVACADVPALVLESFIETIDGLKLLLVDVERV